MSAWAMPGVKCICIDPDHRSGLLSVNAEYTIESVVREGICKTVGKYANGLGVHLVLKGISNPLDREFGAFAIERFRPLITKSQEQDVGLFVHHLDRLEVEA